LRKARFEQGTEEALSAKSTPTDLVSQADLAAQSAIRGLIATERSSDGFLGEEEGQDDPGSSGMRWVVDPLDGTVNFLFGIPVFAVSVACEDASGTVAGVASNPIRPLRLPATASCVAAAITPITSTSAPTARRWRSISGSAAELAALQATTNSLARLPSR